MSNNRLTQIAERLDELNARMAECLGQWETPALTEEMDAMEREYDALFAEAESLGVA
jgi:hypothetical protein